MAAVQLRLTPQDAGMAQRNNASMCLLAVALERQYGGQWSVTPRRAVRISGGPASTLRPGLNAKRVLIRFDATGTMARRGTTVTLYGTTPRNPDRGRRGSAPVPSGHHRQRPSRLRTATGVTAAASALLVADGLAWVLFIILGTALAVLGGIVTMRVRAGRAAWIPSVPDLGTGDGIPGGGMPGAGMPGTRVSEPHWPDRPAMNQDQAPWQARERG